MPLKGEIMNSCTRKLTIRKPTAQDGAAVWKLVKHSGSLDLNSPYAYLMACEMFAGTSAVACVEDTLVGFVTGYRKPMQLDTLFIWQIGIDPVYRGQGIGKQLLKSVLQREENADASYVEATIGPDNTASSQLFLRLADELGTTCSLTNHFEPDWFPSDTPHDGELLYRIGPLLS